MSLCYLIVGLGSIGCRHLANLRSISPDAKIVIYRSGKGQSNEELIEKYDAVVEFSLIDAISHKPRAAILCNPASLHVETAEKLAKSGIHLLIEKPLSNDFNSAKGLLKTCRQNDILLFTAYHLRFLKSALYLKKLLEEDVFGDIYQIFAEVGQYLPSWRPGTNYKEGVSANSELGGGALLELSHEIDYVRWLFGELKNVYAISNISGALEIEVEDNVNILAVNIQGIPVTIHLDFLQRNTSRYCKIITGKGNVFWDIISERITLENNGNIEAIYDSQCKDKNAVYLDELSYFITLIEAQVDTDHRFESGLETLAVLDACMLSIKSKQMIEVKKIES